LPLYITLLLFQGNNRNVNDPNNNPFKLDDVIAADKALLACPFFAIGKPSTIVAAAELAPGMPNSTPLNESPVVDDATTATQNITPRYGSLAKYGITPNRVINPVVAPAAGIMPMTSPKTIPASKTIISIGI
jgi:hypothetical protein